MVTSPMTVHHGGMTLVHAIVYDNTILTSILNDCCMDISNSAVMAVGFISEDKHFINWL